MKRLRHLLTLAVVSLCSWQSAWADLTVTVTNIPTPGELQYEILAQVGDGSINDVTTLIVQSGEMNDADWAILKSMPNLRVLDLSGAESESMPDDQFQLGYGDASLETVSLPSNLKTIGSYAFSGQTNLVSVTITSPAILESVGSGAFSGCSNLESLGFTTWPSTVTVIPSSCFDGCYKLNSFTIPEGVTSIGGSAFQDCRMFSSTLPSTITSVGGYAFSGARMEVDVVIGENVEIGMQAFRYSNIKSIVLPTTFYSSNYDNQYILGYCTNLKDVTIKSPTVLVTLLGYTLLDGCTNSDLKVHVPAHLVADYRLDS